MSPQQILKQIQDGADARFGETIGRLFFILRQRHTHASWRGECYCEYCRFINGQYTNEKLRLHNLKKRLRILENVWSSEHSEDAYAIRESKLLDGVVEQTFKIRELKKEKKELITNVL